MSLRRDDDGYPRPLCPWCYVVSHVLARWPRMCGCCGVRLLRRTGVCGYCADGTCGHPRYTVFRPDMN